MAAGASSFLISASPLLITAPPSSQHNNNHRGIASFGCTPRRCSGLDSGKLVLRCSRKDKRDVRAFVADGNVDSSVVATGKKEADDLETNSTVHKGIKEKKPDVPRPKKDLSEISTILLNVDNEIGDPHKASSIPIYQTATYKQSKSDKYDKYAYTRFGNPTRDMLESILAKLDKGKKALCYTSGMAALTAVTRLVQTGDEIVMGADIYGGSDLLLQQMKERTGVKYTLVDMSNLDKVKAAINEKTKLVWLESPTNPRIRICDIRKIADITHEQGMKPVEAVEAVKDADGKDVTEAVKAREGALLLVDNSIMSPVLSQPLDLKADIVMHSATKFIGGHSDVMAGVLVVNDLVLAKKLKELQDAEGTGLAPFDCWVCLRGIKTMALRVEKQQANALEIAKFLQSLVTPEKDGIIKEVNYVGLDTHPGYAIHNKQADGAGSVLSFTTDSIATSENIVKNVKKFSLTVSFGNVKSLISMPVFMSHKNVKEEDLKSQGLTKDLIRICVGIENAKELIEDLRQAINTPIPEEKPDIVPTTISYVA